MLSNVLATLSCSSKQQLGSRVEKGLVSKRVGETKPVVERGVPKEVGEDNALAKANDIIRELRAKEASAAAIAVTAGARVRPRMAGSGGSVTVDNRASKSGPPGLGSHSGPKLVSSDS